MRAKDSLKGPVILCARCNIESLSSLLRVCKCQLRSIFLNRSRVFRSAVASCDASDSEQTQASKDGQVYTSKNFCDTSSLFFLFLRGHLGKVNHLPAAAETTRCAHAWCVHTRHTATAHAAPAARRRRTIVKTISTHIGALPGSSHRIVAAKTIAVRATLWASVCRVVVVAGAKASGRTIVSRPRRYIAGRHSATTHGMVVARTRRSARIGWADRVHTAARRMVASA